MISFGHYRRTDRPTSLDTVVNKTAHIVNGCLKSTPVQKLYPSLGIAPPYIRREVGAENEQRSDKMTLGSPCANHKMNISFLEKNIFDLMNCRVRQRKTALEG